MTGADYTRWQRAEAAIAKWEAAMTADGIADEEITRWCRRWWAAQVALCRLEPQNVAQAVRQIEVALKDGELAGVDPWAIIERAKAIAGNPTP